MVKNVWQFDLFDFFSYIAPGAVAISLAYPLFPEDVVEGLGTVDGTALALALALGAYVVGHFAQEGSDWLNRVSKQSFEERQEKRGETEAAGVPGETTGEGADEGETSDLEAREADEKKPDRPWFSYERTFDEIANSGAKDQVQVAFFERAPEVLGVDLDEVGSHEGETTTAADRRDQLTTLFHTSKAYLLTRTDGGSGRMEKFQTLHELFHSLVSVFLLFGVVYLVWAVALGLGGLARGSTLGANGVWFLVAGVVLFVFASVSYRLARYYRANQSKVLITEFYTEVLLADRSDEHGRAESGAGANGQ
ncbi:hypothetical protein [Salinigranum sp. GCM10025319]|uniref:hypothetical protein n=1 Tax=Salinigranum sp. GCM10025319 TaxID=3252687 RepID=UPI0036138FEE